MKIKSAAIKLKNGLIWSQPAPLRHSDIICSMSAAGAKTSGSIQGFLADNGEFLDRKEAFKIAAESHQLIPNRRYTPEDVLYTEDLW